MMRVTYSGNGHPKYEQRLGVRLKRDLKVYCWGDVD